MAVSGSSSSGCWSGPMLLIARVYIFLNCVIMGIAGLDFFLTPNQTDDLGNPLRLNLVDYTAALLLVAIGPLGIYAIIKRNPVALKILAWMIATFALYQTVGVISKYITRHTFEQTFKLAQQKYEWHEFGRNNSTKLVDEVQKKFACCGLIDPYEEWTRVRPEYLAEKKDLMPITCCPYSSVFQVGKCLYKNSYNQTCLTEYNRYLMLKLATLIIAIVEMIISALLSFKLAKLSNRPITSAVHVDQFNGCVYFHEPTQQLSIQNQKLPPAYSVTNVSPNPPPEVYSVS